MSEKRIETLTTREALDYMEEYFGESVTKVTLLTWVKRFDLGYQTGGRQLRGFWRIYKEKFHKFLENNYGTR